jgi:hypothetical protein
MMGGEKRVKFYKQYRTEMAALAAFIIILTDEGAEYFVESDTDCVYVTVTGA